MSKFEVSVEIDKKDLKALDKDLNLLFTDIGKRIASAPKMQPIVDKMRQGMSENAMKFQNHPIWEANKHAAREAGLIDFDSPLMVTGQLVQDFIFYAGKPKVSQIPYSNDFILGMFTWADKERKRPTTQYIINEVKRKNGEGYKEVEEKFTNIKTSELVKIITRSPRYPIMDALVTLYHKDISLHTEQLINEVFKNRR